MAKYRKIDVSETRLEHLVRSGPSLIEDGLTFIDHQVPTDRGPLDVLLIDSGGALVVGELKVVETDGILTQGIDYYDYVARNLDALAQAYHNHPIDRNQDPRLLLIAPDFSGILLNRVKWVDIPISLYRWQVLQVEGLEDPMPVYQEVKVPGLPERVTVKTVEDHLSYITDDQIRTLARTALETARASSNHVTTDPIKYAISVKASGSVLFYLEPRRKHFLISTGAGEGGWKSHTVEDEESLEAAMNAVLGGIEA